MKTFASAILLLAFAACAAPAILTPARVPGQCAQRDVDCGRDEVGALCCDEGDVCGGGPFNGCPAAMCCAGGGDDGMPGARAPRNQHRAR